MEILAILAGGITSLIVTIVGFITANKLGVGTSQVQLVSTLKDLVSAQTTRIDQLEEENNFLRTELNKTKEELEELKKVVIELNLRLSKKQRIHSPVVDQ